MSIAIEPIQSVPIELVETFSKMALLHLAAGLIYDGFASMRGIRDSEAAPMQTTVYLWLLEKDRAEILNVIRSYPGPYWLSVRDIKREEEFLRRGVK